MVIGRWASAGVGNGQDVLCGQDQATSGTARVAQDQRRGVFPVAVQVGLISISWGLRKAHFTISKADRSAYIER